MKRKKLPAEAPRSAAHPETIVRHCGVVGIGASAGGLKALQELFNAMPAKSGLAFVVIQHLSPDHESHMAEILGRHTAMKVAEAADGMELRPDAVYTSAPGAYLAIRNGRFCMSAPAAGEGVRMPIDFFLDSLSEDQGDRSVCILLSGTGTDGTHGLRAVRGAGGLAMVQEPGTAEFDAMPKSAMATGLVDYVLPVEAMPRALEAYAGRLRGVVGDEAVSEEDEAVIAQILELLHKQTGNDYSRYKKGTVGRRMARRMDPHQIMSLPDYLKFLTGHPDEVVRLSKDMLISVTSFFRDPEAFEVLRETVIRPLVAAAIPGSSIRAWVPGCATGEEAYSLAILLKEALAARELAGCTVQVFASDIDEGALNVGRAGVYPASIAGDVSPERLARFFVPKDGGWQVTKELRDVVIFSLHNLLADPPFAKLDLVSCRNLLIYIEPDLQGKILALFAFTLNPGGGYLFLGKSETIGKAVDWFELVDEKWRVFRRNSERRPAGEFPLGSNRLRGLAAGRAVPARPHPVNYGDVVRRAALEAGSLGVVVVDARGKVLYLDGPIDRYLDLPAGEPALNVFAMLKERVATRLRSAVRKAAEAGEACRLPKVSLKHREGVVVANLTVRPAGERERDGLVAILFEEARAAEKAVGKPERGASEVQEAPLVEQLEAELRTLREELRATIEDHETSTEEFKSANEEVMSMNEELQSANEELESSREEIQSVNEELGTVNTQLSERLRDLAAVNNDLSNLMAATAIATVFLDRELRIKSFTPSATRLLHLIPADVGRFIGDLAPRFEGVDLAAQAEKVLRELAPVEQEVRSKDNAWHLLRILPYRTIEDKIEGVVVTLTEVTHLKLSEAEAQAAQAYAEGIVETVRGPLVVLDSGLYVISANRAFYDTFGANQADTQGRVFFEVSDGQWDIPRLRALLEKLLPEKTTIEEYVIEHYFPGIGPRAMVINARRIARAHGQPPLILLAIEDVTERTRVADELARSHDELEHRVEERTSELATANANLRVEIEKTRLAEEGLRQSQKLEALGRLAGGVAHDFNNLMTVVTGYADRLLRNQGLAGDQREAIEQMRVAGDRATQLTRQLLAFSRKQILQPVMLDLSGAIADMQQMLRPVLREDIKMVTELAEGLWPVKADPTQINQAIMNLAANARDAMPKGGSLTIRTANVQIDPAGDPPQPDIPAGRYALLEVADTGCGMDEETRGHLFEPFFTTKGAWSGTGLGLSSVYGIVEQSGGFIRVQTAPDQGSAFKMYFPTYVAAPGESVVKGAHHEPEGPMTGGTETVLLVEDEASVRDLVAAELGDLGYRVLATGNLGEAMAAAEAHSGTIDLLLVDVVLPGVSGTKVAEMLKSRGKANRVLYMSGYTEKHIVDHGVLAGGVAFLNKPFTAETLAHKVRQTLDAPLK